MIQLDDVVVRRGGRIILDHIDLTVRQGEFVGILGPNGAGKSTLLKTMLGLMPVNSGRVMIFGSPACRGNSLVGYLPQRRTFGTDVRVRGRDVVRLGLEGTRWGIPLPFFGSRDGKRRIDEVIDLVGSNAYANRAIGELSGGEQQRLLIAQALVAEPRALLLDEPLDSLDLRNQQAVAGVIRRISEERNVTVLLVAHDVNPIEPYLDRVAYISRGHAVIGEPKAVITSETLSRLYDAPIEVLRTRNGRIVVVGQPEEVSYHAHGHR